MALLITTSRKPCARTRTLAKDIQHLLLDSNYANRGKSSLDHVAEIASTRGFDHVLIIYDQKGNPSQFKFMEVFEDEWKWAEPTINIKSVKLRREFEEYRRVKQGPIKIKDKLGIATLFSTEEAEDANLTLSTDKNSISFFIDKTEIGPRMVIRSIH